MVGPTLGSARQLACVFALLQIAVERIVGRHVVALR